jgi:hypothetical protein
MNQTDKIFYFLGWILYIMLAAAAVLQKTGLFFLSDIPGKCSFRQVTGLYCPGCGGTHAIMALAGGHLIQSFLYHPLVPYTSLCFAVFLLWNSTATLFRKKHFPYAHFHIAYVYAGIGILFLQWFVKLFLIIYRP